MIAATTEVDSERIEHGPLTRPKGLKFYNKSLAVTEAEAMLRSGRLSPMDFLKRLSYTAETMLEHQLDIDKRGEDPVQEPEEEDLVELSENEVAPAGSSDDDQGNRIDGPFSLL